jgi:hypothetical protein
MKAEALKNGPPVVVSSLDAWFPELPKALQLAVEKYKLPETIDWQPLAELSSATKFEEIEVYGDSAVLDAGRFIAPASVHVSLAYDPNSKQAIHFADSYPARVYFVINANKKGKNPTIAVDHIEVDTASFFE